MEIAGSPGGDGGRGERGGPHGRQGRGTKGSQGTQGTHGTQSEPERPETPRPWTPRGLRLRVGSVELVPSAWMTSVMEHLERTERELSRQRDDMEDTRAELRRTRDRVAELDSRITDLYGVVNRQRTDVSDQRDAEHHDCAQRFGLLCQRLISVCGGLAALDEPDPEQRPSAEARVTQAVARQLFGPLPPQAHEVLAALPVAATLTTAEAEQLKSLCSEATALRADVARLGGAHRWEFEVDALASAGEYQVWYSCPPKAPAAFAVTPGYVVPGRPPYVRARVFTAG